MRKPRAKYDCYMAVTSDRYELPLAVCDSITELAMKLGKSENNVSSSISHGSSGRHLPYKLIAIKFDDEGEEDEDDDDTKV